jgi:hypothetical protein
MTARLAWLHNGVGMTDDSQQTVTQDLEKKEYATFLKALGAFIRLKRKESG